MFLIQLIHVVILFNSAGGRSALSTIHRLLPKDL